MNDSQSVTTSKQKSNWRMLLLRALVFSAILNGHGLLLFVTDDQYSHRHFTDVDEIFYLQLPFYSAELRPDSAFYFEHNTKSTLGELLKSRPNFVVDYIIGKISLFLGLSPAMLGHLLDLVLAVVVYLLFTQLFRLFTPHQIAAEASAAVLLTAPWAFAIDQYINIPIPFFSHIVSSPVGWNHGVPILRGIYTQVSYPIWGLALYCLAKALLQMKGRWFWYGAASVLSATLFYIYFFAWGSSVTMLFISLLLAELMLSLREHMIRFKEIAARISWCTTLHLAFLSFGLVTIYTMKKHGLAPAEFISSYWYFSIELFIVFMAASYLLYQLNRAQSRNTVPIVFVVAAIISQFLLMNLQPLLGVGLCPYHFPQLYLQPLYGSLLLLVLLDQILSRPAIRKQGQSLCAIGLVFVVSYQGYSIYRRPGQSPEFAELVSYLAKHTPRDSVIAFPSVRTPFVKDVPQSFIISPDPNAIATLSGKYLLHQDWVMLNDDKVDTFMRELMLGWLYSGTPQPLWPCITKTPDSHGDLFYLTWTYYLLERMNICSSTITLRKSVDPCELISKYRLNYVIWDRSLTLDFPAWYQQVMSLKWTSSGEYYKVFLFERAKAKELFCHTAVRTVARKG